MYITPLQQNSRFSRHRHHLTVDNSGELDVLALGLGFIAPTPTDMCVLLAATSPETEFPVSFAIGPRRLNDIADELALVARAGNLAEPYAQQSADMAAIIQAAVNR